MRPVVGLVRRHAVAICKLPMDFRVKVGKCGPEDFVELSRAVLIRRAARLRRVVEKVIGEELVEHFKIPANGIGRRFSLQGTCSGGRAMKTWSMQQTILVIMDAYRRGSPQTSPTSDKFDGFRLFWQVSGELGLALIGADFEVLSQSPEQIAEVSAEPPAYLLLRSPDLGPRSTGREARASSGSHCSAAYQPRKIPKMVRCHLPDPFNKRPEVLGEAPPGLDVHLHEFAKIAVFRRLGAAVGDLPDVVRTILEDADRAISPLRLVKAFMKIPRPAVRHRLVALVCEIAGDDGE